MCACLLARQVIEYRQAGNSDHESVLKALAKTGYVITMAGLIMSLAFLGMVPAHEQSITQIGFILLVAAISDTFVVRAALIPMAMHILGSFNWWPRKLPATVELAIPDQALPSSDDTQRGDF